MPSVPEAANVELLDASVAPAIPATRPPDPTAPTIRHPKTGSLPRTGKLVLSIVGASSAEIFIDQAKAVLGRGGELVLSPGSHAVEVRATGMLPDAFRVEITAGLVTRRSVALKRATSVEPRAGSDDDHMLYHSGDLKKTP
jgi:hypothetical protein